MCSYLCVLLISFSQLRQMVSFTEVPPGLYRVWVYPVGIFDHVCSATPALNITGIGEFCSVLFVCFVFGVYVCVCVEARARACLSVCVCIRFAFLYSYL